MSRRGRYVIDRMKVWAIKWNLKMPVPPYDDVNYWEGVYRTTKSTDPPFEWGNLSCSDFVTHTYIPIPITTIPSFSSITLPLMGQTSTSQHESVLTSLKSPMVKPIQVRRKNGQPHTRKHQQKEEQQQQQPQQPNGTQHNGNTSPSDSIASDQTATTPTPITTTLGELLGNVHPNGPSDESILILGCGTSRFGEELIQNEWNGPIVQLDCSSRLMEQITTRYYDSYISTGKMIAIQDDATVLSALNEETIHAVFDKGLMDAFFCTDSDTYLTDTLSSVHRVLRPNGTFCTLSLSHPEFLLPKLLPALFTPVSSRSSTPPSSQLSGVVPHTLSRNMMQQRQQQVHRLWSHIEIRLLMDYMYCYRFTKK
jgi:ubiquinone/menaquinone biosynthesis C-methylase UbiE